MMVTVASRLGGVASQSRLSEDLNDVSALEVAVVNEHYNLREYVGRRADIVGDQFKNVKNVRIDPFKIARSDADEVFDSNLQDLSVQEVRRRELRKGIEPLLPLPTTANTQTIDNFQSYPPVEWTPGAGTLLPTTIPGTEGPRFTQVNSTSSLAGAQGPSKTSPRSFTLSVQRPQSSTAQQQVQPAAQAMNGLADQANTTMAFNGPQQTTQGQLADMSSSPFQDNSFSSSFAIDPRLTAATSPASIIDSDSAMQLDQPKAVLTDPELARKVANALGTEEAKQLTGFFTRKSANVATAASAQTVANGASVKNGESTEDVENAEIDMNAETSETVENTETGTIDSTPARAEDVMEAASKSKVLKVPKQVFYPEGVASLAGRGMHPPVKPQRKKRTRGASSDQSKSTSEDESIQDQPDIEQPPPKKKLKLVIKGRRQPPDGTAENTATSLSNRKTPARKSTAKHIESVISGNALPRTAEEAHAAAESRLTRLIANHNADRKARKRGAIKPDHEPDFMPEHFYTKNFEKGMERDTVRCVCGTIVDDGRNMIACDDCGVWQHHICMGDGVPENADEEQYSCHVCDPWAHRELIGRLRRENQL